MPLVIVLAVTMAKEAYDDVQRWRTDVAINHQRYERLLPSGAVEGIRAQDICVGHVIRVVTDQRVPADLVMLRTRDASGTAFVRTDQLDGETDWKLRLAAPPCQKLPNDGALAAAVLTLRAAPPSPSIYEFEGDVTLYDETYEGGCVQEPLGLENTLWANTVLASGTVVGVVVHTGVQTRSAMNSSSSPPSKVATLDLQVNSLVKVLFGVVCLAALSMVSVPLVRTFLHWTPDEFASALPARLAQAGLDFVCFVLLFSQIIPISLRVALDVAKLVFKLQMTSDAKMRDRDGVPGLQVRSSTIPEELGGIEYLLTDKTGTLTRNEMRFKKLHLGFKCLSDASTAELQQALAATLAAQPGASLAPPSHGRAGGAAAVSSSAWIGAGGGGADGGGGGKAASAGEGAAVAGGGGGGGGGGGWGCSAHHPGAPAAAAAGPSAAARWAAAKSTTSGGGRRCRRRRPPPRRRTRAARARRPRTPSSPSPSATM